MKKTHLAKEPLIQPRRQGAPLLLDAKEMLLPILGLVLPLGDLAS